MQNEALRTLGKWTLLTAGAAWGLVQGFRLAGGLLQRENAGLLSARLDEIESRLRWQVEATGLQSQYATQSRYATHEDVAAAVNAAVLRMDDGIGKRFEVQNLAIGALREMIAHTDDLLERVLEAMESAREEPSLAESETALSVAPRRARSG